jgi:hypothetical protein
MCATARALNISLPNAPCADCQAAVRTEPWLDRDGDRSVVRCPLGVPVTLEAIRRDQERRNHIKMSAIANRARTGFVRRLGLEIKGTDEML